MNLNLIKINVIVLILAIESHGGLIEGIYGKVQNTTTGLRQDVRNIWSYSKSLVGHNTTEPADGERGLIGGIIHSVHEKVHNLKEKFWDVDEIPSDSGLLWSWWNRMKQRLSRAKDYITGNDAAKPIEEPPKEETKIIQDTLNSLFYENGTRRVHGNAFKEAVENLRKKLAEIREVSGTTTETPDNHGEGLLDVRFGAEDANARKGLELKPNSFVIDKDGGMLLSDKVSDAARKEKDLLDSTYQKLNQGAKNIGDGVKETAEDMARLA